MAAAARELVLQIAKACLHRGVGCLSGGKLVLCIGLDLAGLPLRVRRRRDIGRGGCGERIGVFLGGFRERDGRIRRPRLGLLHDVTGANEGTAARVERLLCCSPAAALATGHRHAATGHDVVSCAWCQPAGTKRQRLMMTTSRYSLRTATVPSFA